MADKEPSVSPENTNAPALESTARTIGSTLGRIAKATGLGKPARSSKATARARSKRKASERKRAAGGRTKAAKGVKSKSAARKNTRPATKKKKK